MKLDTITGGYAPMSSRINKQVVDTGLIRNKCPYCEGQDFKITDQVDFEVTYYCNYCDMEWHDENAEKWEKSVKKSVNKNE